MSTIHSTNVSHDGAQHKKAFESMSPREQLLGILVLILVLLLAVFLQWM